MPEQHPGLRKLRHRREGAQCALYPYWGCCAIWRTARSAFRQKPRKDAEIAEKISDFSQQVVALFFKSAQHLWRARAPV
jgi:hypothetical protein